MNKIYFAKAKPEAKIPSKRSEDAGYDIYACFDEPYIEIMPHETVMIPTGIVSACDEGYCFVLKERGSTGTKGIAQRCGVIDSGFRGEWFVPITNTTVGKLIIYNDYDAVVKNYAWYMTKLKTCCFEAISTERAIAQALLIPVPQTEVVELTLDEINSFESERGVGALGSSQK